MKKELLFLLVWLNIQSLYATLPKDSTRFFADTSLQVLKEHPVSFSLQVFGPFFPAFNAQVNLFSHARYSAGLKVGGTFQRIRYLIDENDGCELEAHCRPIYGYYKSSGGLISLVGQYQILPFLSSSVEMGAISIEDTIGSGKRRTSYRFGASVIWQIPDYHFYSTLDFNLYNYYGSKDFVFFGLNFGYRFSESVRLRTGKVMPVYIYQLPKNSITINNMAGVGYERLLFHRRNHGFYAAISTDFSRFKRFRSYGFYTLSTREGHYLYAMAGLNYVQKYNPYISSEMGIFHANYEQKFDLNGQWYYEKTRIIGLNIGVRWEPLKHLLVKINFVPPIWASNQNYTKSEAQSEHYEFYDYLLESEYMTQAFKLSIGYNFFFTKK